MFTILSQIASMIFRTQISRPSGGGGGSNRIESYADGMAESILSQVGHYAKNADDRDYMYRQIRMGSISALNVAMETREEYYRYGDEILRMIATKAAEVMLDELGQFTANDKQLEKMAKRLVTGTYVWVSKFAEVNL